MGFRLNHENRTIVIVVPKRVPPPGKRAGLHRLLDLALDGFDSLRDGAELGAELVAPNDPPPLACKKDDAPWDFGARDDAGPAAA